MTIGEMKKGTILIIDDAKPNQETLRQILNTDYHVLTADNGIEGVSKAIKHTPDLILLDVVMPQIDGYATITLLKEIEHTQRIPVIFISTSLDEGDKLKGLDSGAADYIVSPFDPALVNLRVRVMMQLVYYIKEIERLSIVDRLTNVPNRFSLDTRLALEWGRAARAQTPLSILILDLDNFKIFNNTYGHLQGDEILKAVAKTLSCALKRACDYVGRWGGEEFLVILPQTNIAGSIKVAEMLRGAVARADIAGLNDLILNATVSIGINTIVPRATCQAGDFVAATDKALRAAKDQGRNRVVHADQLSFPDMRVR